MKRGGNHKSEASLAKAWPDQSTLLVPVLSVKPTY